MTRHQLLGLLERGLDEPENNAHFRNTISIAVQFLDLTTYALATKFDCPQSTIRRWLGGRTAPHPSHRPAVYSYLIDVLLGVQ